MFCLDHLTKKYGSSSCFIDNIEFKVRLIRNKFRSTTVYWCIIIKTQITIITIASQMQYCITSRPFVWELGLYCERMMYTALNISSNL